MWFHHNYSSSNPARETLGTLYCRQWSVTAERTSAQSCNLTQIDFLVMSYVKEVTMYQA